MSESVNITVRIPRKLKEELRKYRIKISEVVRRALEKEVERRKMEELRRIARELGDFLSRMSEEEIVKSIKEFRRSR
mgnify:CR=1 FL=1